MFRIIENEQTNYWVSLIDMMASILVVFLLVTYIDTVLNEQNIDLAVMDYHRKEFLDEFDVMFKGTDVIRIEKLDHLRIKFSNDVLFRSEEYQLLPDGVKTMKNCAKLLKDTARIRTIDKIQVEGHTDDKEFYKSRFPGNNWELSTARALTVVQLLIDEGVDGTKFSANGFESNVVADTLDPTNRKLNRRIELKIIFKGVEDNE